MSSIPPPLPDRMSFHLSEDVIVIKFDRKHYDFALTPEKLVSKYTLQQYFIDYDRRCSPQIISFRPIQERLGEESTRMVEIGRPTNPVSTDI